MAVELATGYVSLVVDTAKIPAQVDQALGKAAAGADRAGQSMGSRLSDGLTKTLKVGAAAAGVAAGGLLGTALAKGMGRLVAIDNAEAKLRALGHSTSEVATIMDSALESVKGTAFGLGDAATLAATAVAAGIAPGQELTKYLSLVGDAAAIAGADLSDMGRIFNQVQTGQRAYTDDLNQLADRGIPIYQWIADEAGIAAGEVKEFAAEGKISSEMFIAAVEKNIGGAAKNTDSFSASLANTGAALSRLGAAALEPTFDRLNGGLQTSIGLIDSVTPKVQSFAEALDRKLFDDVIPSAVEFWDTFRESESAADAMLRVETVVSSLADSAAAAGPALVSIGKSLVEATAAVGVSAWSVFLSVLESVAQIADAVLVPALETTADLMQENKGLVTALVAGWVAFKTVPGIISAVTGVLSPLATKVVGAATAMRGFSDQMRLQQSLAASSGQSVGMLGAAAATAQTRIGGLRGALSSVVGFLGGPWGVALAAGSVAMIGIVDSLTRASRQEDINRDATEALSAAHQDLAVAFEESGGAANDFTLDAATAAIEAYREQIEKTADTAPSALSKFLGTADFADPFTDTGNWWRVFTGGKTEATEAAERAKNVKAALDELGMSSKDLAAAVAGTPAEFAKLTAALDAQGEGGRAAAEALRAQRDEYLSIQSVAAKTTPGFHALSEAVGVLADEASSADDQLGALRSALVALGIIEQDTTDALASYGESIADIVTGSAGAVDATNGLGDAMLDANGKLDVLNNAGARGLHSTLQGLADEFLNTARATGDAHTAYANAAPALQALADSYQLPIEKIRELAAAAGMTPDVVQMLVDLQGADTVEQKLVTIKAMLDANADGVTIPTDALTDETIAKLQDVEGMVVRVDESQGIVFVDAPNEEAMRKLNAVVAELGLIPNQKNVTVRVSAQWDPEARAAYFGDANVQGPFVAPGMADGGALSGGIPGRDSIPILGMPGEHMLDRDDVRAMGGQQAVYDFRRALHMADGGAVPGGVANAISAARSVDGNAYLWGGTGPTRFDCCLTAGSMVYGPDGAKPIDEVRPGFRVFTYADDGAISIQTVTAQWFSKRQPVFKVRTRNRAIIASGNHPFMRMRKMCSGTGSMGPGNKGFRPDEFGVEWVRLDELSVGDFVVQPKSMDTESKPAPTLRSGRPIGLNTAWMLGLMVGDGHVTDRGPRLCVYGDIRERAIGVMVAEFGMNPTRHDTHGIYAQDAEFVADIEALGMRYPGPLKRVPEAVWAWPEELQRAFLNGYCDADGHFPRNVPRHGERTYTSASRRLIDEVRALHIMLGDPVSNVSVNNRPHPIVIKGKRVARALPLHSFAVWSTGTTRGTYAVMRDNQGFRDWMDSGDFTAARIVAISPEGDQDTYDIEVSGNHNFIADGVVVHNSGFIGWLQQILMGSPSTRRLYTTYSLLGGALAGLKSGLGPAGTWFQVGVNQEHMAGTLAGYAVESGGAHGTSGIGGGRASAQSSQFGSKFHLPNELIAGIAAAATGRTGGGSGYRSGRMVTWTESDDLDLDKAKLAVDDAKARRDAVYNDAESSDIDKREADLRVREAEAKAVELQQKKDSAGMPTPEAPALEKSYSDDEIEYQRKVLAVEEARQRRNETYADLTATESDRLRADLDLAAAENALAEAQTTAKAGSGGSIKERVKQLGAELVGIGVDAALEHLPFGIGSSHWWDVDIPDEAVARINGVPATFPQQELDRQMPVTTDGDPEKLAPYAGTAPPWIQEWIKQAKIFDNGGWLEPGGIGINLGNRPEPIFSSPEQLAQFAGQLHAPDPRTSAGEGIVLNINGPNPQQIAREVQAVLRTYQMRSGSRVATSS